MKIALTGASGRVGRRIAAMALEQGHSLVCIDQQPAHPSLKHEGVRFIQAEMADYDALVEAFAGCDALIHMAAIPSPGRHPDHVIHNNNVVGSYNALRAAAEHGIMRICQASSVNAIGHAFSRHARYDYFPLDEAHPNYNEEPYSLSKWICEQQADSFVRRYEEMRIASMRFHYVVPERSVAAEFYPVDSPVPYTHLWAWTHQDAAADACMRSLVAPFDGHEVFYIVAPITTVDAPSLKLAAEHFPNVPIHADLPDNRSFFSSAKAEKILGWNHDAAIGQSNGSAAAV
ncbi:NAD(P)-dependent oxidoreductase [Devosia rhodophyticola]|uniref:NAD(P)-dependent oxidoreductase n=1 Tax=Devosia rhodophyticola TaxID=3026423 RepID=A0ABY7YXX6_9HYPH|nr:NAD(P)-dependent oxidoreductase [Devosia rhodophyticola]WDR06176.1 NAD(P)-dependent oxidoreductase [Devosia rhodophyticola]